MTASAFGYIVGAMLRRKCRADGAGWTAAGLTALLAASAVLAQEQEPAPAVGDEIVVRGVSPAFLRRERERAEDRMFALFNELNERDEFDIHCRDEAPLGTRMTRRVCAPNFVTRANSDASRQMLYGMTGGYGGDPQVFLAGNARKFRQMQAELAKLMAKHSELASAVTRVANLQRMRAADDDEDARTVAEAEE